MNLPSKDKNGKSYLSYSAINSYLKDRNQFVKTYILKEPFEGNAYTNFGSRVGKAIETNDFSLFKKSEIKILNSVKRLDEFERKVFLDFDSFYMIGFIDSNTFDLTKITDYKTGGTGKHIQYYSSDYVQMCYYALAIKQETGIKVKEATVQFVHRGGTLKSGLFVDDKPIIEIKTDVSDERLKNVYWTTIKIAKEIELFYLDYISKNPV